MNPHLESYLVSKVRCLSVVTDVVGMAFDPGSSYIEGKV